MLGADPEAVLRSLAFPVVDGYVIHENKRDVATGITLEETSRPPET